MFAAFKMGLYFKLFITVMLILRFASHSSQRQYPVSAVSRELHFNNISSSVSSPSMRIILLTQSGYSYSLSKLLKSLNKADYQRDSIALDVWMFASSTCDYLPLPVYPLAMAIFGPPRFDHSIPTVVNSISWNHGQKTLIAVRSEPDLSTVWQSNRGTTNETLLFIDATLTQQLSPSFYIWLKKARLAMQRGMIANTAVISLDSLSIPDGVPASDNAVLIEQFFPATAAFSPTQDAWLTFLKWYSLRSRSLVAHPILDRDLPVGGYNLIESMRVPPIRAWFSQFLASYRERVLHPILPENQSLVLRMSGTTQARVAGTGAKAPVHLDPLSEVTDKLYGGSSNDMSIPERPVLIKANGIISAPRSTFGMNADKIAGKTRLAVIEDVVDEDMTGEYREALRRIAEFSRSRGSRMISMTMITKSYVETALSWLCNVALLDIAPASLVIITSDRNVSDSMSEFIKRYPRLDQGSIVISMEHTIDEFTRSLSREQEMVYGSKALWMLMLHRSFLIRDLLTQGISVLHFETDQIWLSDPMPYIRHELDHSSSSDSGTIDDYRAPDVVLSVDSKNEVAGSFMYLRPTVGTRHLMCEVVDRFFNSYRASQESRRGRKRKYDFTSNDQSILSALLLRQDRAYAKLHPEVKMSVLDSQLFVDGMWFLDFEDSNGKRVGERTHYRSESSLYPVVLNNNFIDGVENKRMRAKRFGFWFLKKTNNYDNMCDEEAVRKAGRSGSEKENRESAVVELGKPNLQL